MYNYILLQWRMATVPKFITDEQCATILATPQNPQSNSTKEA